MLEQMVDTVYFLYRVLAVGKSLFYSCCIGITIHLCVFGAVESQYGALYFRQQLACVYSQEMTDVRRVSLLQRFNGDRFESLGHIIDVYFACFLATGNLVECLADAIAVGVNHFLWQSYGRHGLTVLHDECLLSRYSHSSKRHNEVGLAFCGKHHGDGAALAMTEYAYFVETLTQQR